MIISNFGIVMVVMGVAVAGVVLVVIATAVSVPQGRRKLSEWTLGAGW